MTKRDAEELGVLYVPMTYSINGVVSEENFVDLCGEYESLLDEKNSLRTSQANVHAFLQVFDRLRADGHEVLCLAISSRLSGTYNNALNCARELGEDRIKVVDTRTTAGGLLLLSRAARRLIRQGCSLSQTAEKIARMSYKVGIAFSVGDMAPLRRSGRLGPVRQSIGTILNMKPILMCKDGHIIASHVVRGNRERISDLVRMVPKDATEVIVHYLQSPESAGDIASVLKERYGLDATIRKICPALGIHLGADVIGIAWIQGS